MNDNIYIILVNYNGWKDTIECLESIFKSSYKHYKVIVCDNNSTDCSLSKIKDWAMGKLEVDAPQCSLFKNIVMPFVKKPIIYVDEINTDYGLISSNSTNNARLILLQTGQNGGFAFANNIGIKYALMQSDFSYIWLLNNDTIIANNALNELVKFARLNNLGQCGTRTYLYYEPCRIQCYGGWGYNKWIATPYRISEDNAKLGKLDYIDGSSMLVSKDFIINIGFMNEIYFLYFEEIDWSTRNHNRFRLGYAEKSIIYHKCGGTTKSNSSDKTHKSYISDYYSIRNRILFTHMYYMSYLPILYLSLSISLFNRFHRKQYNRIQMIIKLILSSLFNYKSLYTDTGRLSDE